LEILTQVWDTAIRDVLNDLMTFKIENTARRFGVRGMAWNGLAFLVCSKFVNDTLSEV